MKKQNNEGLMQELTSHLDWNIMEASDEEFDPEQVQALMKLLDSLKSEEKGKAEAELPEEAAVNDFWKYCEEREAEERILSDREENSEKENTAALRKGKREIVPFFQKHRGVIVAAVVLLAIIFGGSWQVVANAEKHGGFFWWMDKSEEGTTMITSPEDFGNTMVERYYDLNEIPEEYAEYVNQILQIPLISEYNIYYSQIVKGKLKDKIYVYIKNEKEFMRFEIIIYPKKLLWARETYSSYVFENEVNDNGVTFDILSKEEVSGEKTYLIYFYYGNTQYIIAGKKDKETLLNIATEYKNVILSYND